MSSKIKYIITNTVVVIVIFFVIQALSVYKSFENNIYDYFLLFNRVQSQQNEVVVIKIDDKSLENLGIWPWKREVYAALLKKIFDNGAQCVGIYLDFTIPGEPESDTKFLRSLEQFPVVVINPYTFAPDNTTNAFWKKIKNVSKTGHDIFRTDYDGVIRKYSPVLNHQPSFVLSILNILEKQQYYYNKSANKLVLNDSILTSANNQKININFKHAWYDFKTFSFYKVLNQSFSGASFKDKIVLIGMTKQGLADYYTTPFSKKFTFSGKIAPVYVQAQILDSLKNYPLITSIPLSYLVLVLVILTPIILIFTQQLSILRQITVLVFIFPASLLVFCYLLFKHYTIWFTPAPFLVMSLLVFMTLLLTQSINISSFLDKYIVELSKTRDNKELIDIEPGVSDKLVALREITDFIERDRQLLDTVLKSVNSLIILFDSFGNIVYSNDTNKFVEKEILIRELNFEKTIQQLKEVEVYRKNINYKNKNYEFVANKAGANLYTGVFNDLTAIVKVNETKSNIIRMLTHEMKTSLTTILLSCDFLTAVDKEGLYKKYINNIAGQTEFLRDLIANFINLNKLEVEELELCPEKLNFVHIIHSIINDLKLYADTKSINISFNDKFEETLFVQGDKKYITVLLKNLLDNAIKYSPENTNITISIWKEGKDIIISFKDEGFGIPESEIPRLFNKFHRVKTEKTEKIQGTGLGLSFVKKIIELHNGTIKVKSQLEQGSEFIVSLPSV
jgi:signal transduction histidine kinase